MKSIVRVCDRPLLLLDDNIDTDQIIPARFLRKPRTGGYQHYLLHDVRFNLDGTPRPESPIAHHQPPRRILLAGRNFGCGSSREGAVYAVVDYGIEVVISTAIADIFRGNAIRNGLLPIVVTQDQFNALVVHAQRQPDAELEVDLQAMTLGYRGQPGQTFEIDAGSRHRLLNGLDDIGETLARRSEIDQFARRRQQNLPWIFPFQA